MAARAAGGDPRLNLPQPDDSDIRPMVAAPARALPIWVMAAGLAVFALILFLMLDSRRRALESPAVTGTPTRQMSTGSEPPPLYIPPAVQSEPMAPVQAQAAPTIPFVLPQPPTRQARPEYVPMPVPPPPMPQPMQLPDPPMAMPRESGSALVLDRSGPPGADGDGEGSAAPASQPPGIRATAGMLANRATTVAQGTLIPAVLETGLDSTKPGFARAIVSRDVRSFDGSRVLIPRGSRLTGEYEGGASQGQRRAVINWTRLVRPDGVTIAIGSPASDSVGRGGIRAKVDSHLWERLFPALLQSVLDIGVNVASRAADGSVVLALPGSGGGSGGLLGGRDAPAPTLTVKPGTSIAIFVNRDLDFTGVGNPQ